MSKDVRVYRGNVIFAERARGLTAIPGGYIVVENGLITGAYESLPEKFVSLPCSDFGDKLIIPGFVDIHVHAAQYENMGLGLDKELMQWLEAYTFPEESKFYSLEYAESVYGRFVQELRECGTTRAVIFATVHREATALLFKLLLKAGLGAFVGKVNMDMSCPESLLETAELSLADTEWIIDRFSDKHSLVRPIITPRFVPTCSSGLMSGLGRLAREHGLPVQSHLSENRDEISFVRSLYPGCTDYAAVYEQFGLLGGEGGPAIMAHCVHSPDTEIDRLTQSGAFIAHCPASNTNLSSGVAPVRRYLDSGLNVGLGSDVSGGHSLFMPHSIVCAVQSSKLYGLYKGEGCGALTVNEAFYMATKGGGKFFGNVGSFEGGYQFDALVIDDSAGLNGVNPRNLAERLERFMYKGTKHDIVKRFVNGKEV